MAALSPSEHALFGIAGQVDGQPGPRSDRAEQFQAHGQSYVGRRVAGRARRAMTSIAGAMPGIAEK